MVVRKNVLEYIIALVVVKNKVRLKKCLKIFQIWQSSIVQINLSITSLRLILKFSTSFRRSMLISFWIDVPGADPGGRAHPVRAPTLKLEKIWFFDFHKCLMSRNNINKSAQITFKFQFIRKCQISNYYIQISLSITSFKINTTISTSFRRSMLISFWIDMTSICTLSMS